MALAGQMEKKNVEGKEQDVFVATVTNGTVAQLREIATYLEAEGFTIPTNPTSDPKIEADRLKEVLRVGIAWLERLKENKKNTDTKE